MGCNGSNYTNIIIDMKNVIVFLIVFIYFGSFCQKNSQNSELKKIIKTTINKNKGEFENQDTLYFEIPNYFKLNSLSEKYYLKRKNGIVICLFSQSEIFINDKIDHYYVLEKRESGSFYLYKYIHPRIGIGRKLISE